MMKCAGDCMAVFKVERPRKATKRGTKDNDISTGNPSRPTSLCLSIASYTHCDYLYALACMLGC
jgi:hypothetical protein